MNRKILLKKYIIFDLDGTLYQFKGGSFNRSTLKKKIIKNARKFIADQLQINNLKAGLILKNIMRTYKEEISLGLEKKYGLNRFKYFNTVWNIPAENIVEYNYQTRALLNLLQKKNILLLISDAPKIWIQNVIKVLKIENIFKDKIFSGESDIRKGFKNAFETIIKKMKTAPNNCIVIGDQEDTDIRPAKKIGMTTIFVNKHKVSKIADYNISEFKKDTILPILTDIKKNDNNNYSSLKRRNQHG